MRININVCMYVCMYVCTGGYSSKDWSSTTATASTIATSSTSMSSNNMKESDVSKVLSNRDLVILILAFIPLPSPLWEIRADERRKQWEEEEEED